MAKRVQPAAADPLPTADSAISRQRLETALTRATDALRAELVPDGHWVGELSSSALSTATAVVALAKVERHLDLVAAGLRWLAAHVNADGGWGDTVRSKSNISTTALCWAAFGAARADAEFPRVVAGAQDWLDRAADFQPAGSLKERAPAIAGAIQRRYGKDRTFSVPILMTLALGGRLGANGWQYLTPLPFELAALPHQIFGALQLPVVSYALPALIAIGQAIHHHHPTEKRWLRFIRDQLRARTLRVLATLQPEDGGFLEATPLTSFVTMSLVASGLGDEMVTLRGIEFLRGAARPDGSWPIDTNLATWTTTLAIKALSHQPDALSPEQKLTLREWLLDQQYRVEHPYTHAAPGGWAWTNLSGGVPDADDTPGALLALLHLGVIDGKKHTAGMAGCRWLMGLQNRDGGIPSFCRGWGALPFDRSSPDLTAHALRAWGAWRTHWKKSERHRLDDAVTRALRYLVKSQRADGAWIPLWFGNEHAPNDENPLYGTAHVVVALRELQTHGATNPPELLPRGVRWLAAAQNEDGGWGGVRGAPSSVEETALAIEALAGTAETRAVEAGVRWLVERVESGAWREPSPIGFYFAKLWYHERLYPLIFTVGTLGKVTQTWRLFFRDIAASRLA
ncbi:MAG: squalene-hopene/tetraprenyl-beta-curcumene cyclase [Chthoniobacter sp.]|jgi:squalene-hopene/tetraprenyl-beta-curcumene cyclase|nr:squalene-hopene/tetraprenyl-beta-curcumene cyclase [Chthoniobacter sp.]